MISKTLITIFILFLTACSEITYNRPITLSVPAKINQKIDIKVVDSRDEKTLPMTAVGYAGMVQIWTFLPTPLIEIGLEDSIKDLMINNRVQMKHSSILVTINNLEIKNSVGYATRDKLACKFESTVNLNDGDKKSTSNIVKTYAKNEENLSPFVTVAAKVIVDLCLKKHAEDIVNFIKD